MKWTSQPLSPTYHSNAVGAVSINVDVTGRLKVEGRYRRGEFYVPPVMIRRR
ncbi:MAG: hypothetical protein RMJ28_06495 [Nitrososphaerota archaeon]|nr:hypothetical protein [Candidatus Calditenuaceae archaeon]MDW8073864.1 hypothetical protein [Nitrososphaerota archaeon]